MMLNVPITPAGFETLESDSAQRKTQALADLATDVRSSNVGNLMEADAFLHITKTVLVLWNRKLTVDGKPIVFEELVRRVCRPAQQRRALSRSTSVLTNLLEDVMDVCKLEILEQMDRGY